MAPRSKSKPKPDVAEGGTPFGLIRQIDIDTEMQQAYLDYAMSVIVARALPDVRDGLKPVHRRILYAMHDMGLQPNTAYKKSARIVGEVLGKYHPHGDAAVYDSMARMAQDFSMRYLLVDGQGNFGSVDGDAPAAMRYTEARLASMAAQLLGDIDKNTVDFGANFDGSLKEPLVLPSATPNLLLNGASGIAVGMATNIPPHNLNEICDAIAYLIGRWQKIDRVTVDELMEHIKGPDFPTGGVLFRYNELVEGGDAIRAAYATGRGRISIQAKAFIEEAERGKSRIIVTELPYQVNKSSLIERIADLVRDGKLEGITDLRDESDRSGMRIIIELSRTVDDPRKMLSLLYKYTPMQSTFGIINLALVEGEPRLLPLKRMLQLFIEHRQVIITRRSEYDLARAKERAHILEGLLKALANLDEVIRIIRHSADAEAAKQALMKKFKLSEVQTVAILDMPLRRLARLEREKLEAEYKEKKALIKHLEELLHDPKKILGVIRSEMLALKEKFGNPRRTQIVEKKVKEAEVVTGHDLVASESAWMTIYQDGSVYRMPIGPAILEGKLPAAFVHADARDTIIAITERGQAGAIAAHQISGQGMPVAEVFGVPSEQRVIAAIALPKDVPDLPGYLFMTTRQGVVKRVTLVDLVQAFGSFSVMNVAEDDALISACITPGEAEVILASAHGQAIRFSEEDVRPMGFNAGGVAGMKLIDNDQVVGADVMQPRSDLMLLTQNGLGKRAALAEFPKQGRAGQGVVAIKIDETDQVIGAAVVQAADQVAVVTSRGKSKLVKARVAKNAPRAAIGAHAYHLTKTEKITAVIKPTERVVAPIVPVVDKTAEKTAAAQPDVAAAKPKAVKQIPAKKISRKTR
jgi:DNA gyrase subunit A